MDLSASPAVPCGLVAVRVGCALVYQLVEPAHALVVVQPRPAASQVVLAERLVIGGRQCVTGLWADSHGNSVVRTLLGPGATEIRYDTIVLVPDSLDQPVPHAGADTGDPFLPLDVLRYTLPSRYCESDKLGTMAASLFGHLRSGRDTAQAICNWTHHNIEYRYGSGDASLSACEAIGRGYGVCRDFAHVMVALCRSLDLPARYVAGYMPLFEASDSDIGIDFHAYVEVYIDGAWHIFDPRHNRAHVGRVKIAHGMDATDVAFATIFGRAETLDFRVWSYPVDSAVVQVGDPVELPSYAATAP